MSPSPLSLNTMTFPQDAQTPFMSPNYASTSTFQGPNGETGYVDVANSQTFMHMPSSNALGLSGMQLETASPTSPRDTPSVVRYQAAPQSAVLKDAQQITSR